MGVTARCMSGHEVHITRGTRVTHIRSSSRRTGRLLAAAVVSLGLVAGACSKKDDGASTDSTATQQTDATEESVAPVETSGGSTDTTVAETTVETDPPVAAKEPVYGGTLIVSGEAEVANAWTPAAMQCDSYCQQRARSFYDPLIAINADLKPVGVLVESFEANADSTEFTLKRWACVMCDRFKGRKVSERRKQTTCHDDFFAADAIRQRAKHHKKWRAN